MNIRVIPQAWVEHGQIVDRSPSLDDSLVARIEQLSQGFGDSPVDALALQPLDRGHVGIFSARAGRCRALVLRTKLFHVIPDPFAILARFPMPERSEGSSSDLEWPLETLPRRTVADLEAVLKDGDGPFLLGACQTLVDSGRLAIVRDGPDDRLVRELWSLLPDSIRRQTTFTTWMPRPLAGPSIIVVPALPPDGLPGYLNEDQARDYPESRYERELQYAVEHGDQRTLDRLLARRSSADTLRLALWMIAFAFLFALAMKIVNR